MQKKSRRRPFYKQFVNLKNNIQDRPKFFNFKKKKWSRFVFFEKLKARFFKRYKVRDPLKRTRFRFLIRRAMNKMRFKDFMFKRQLFNLFYGGFNRKTLKRKLVNLKKTKHNSFATLVLGHFESRLDVVLVRAKFVVTIKSARQIIAHGHILVNDKVIKSGSYQLNCFDLIKIGSRQVSQNLIRKQLFKAKGWPIPPKHLIVNYRTLQISFCYDKNKRLYQRFLFSHHLSLPTLLENVKRW